MIECVNCGWNTNEDIKYCERCGLEFHRLSYKDSIQYRIDKITEKKKNKKTTPFGTPKTKSTFVLL